MSKEIKELKEKITSWADTNEEPIIFYDEFDDAMLGLSLKFNEYSVVYDYTKCIDILMHKQEFTYDESVEHMSYNVMGGYVGSSTPTFIINEFVEIY